MKHNKDLFSLAIIVCLFFACAQADRQAISEQRIYHEEVSAASDISNTPVADYLSSSAALVGRDTSRKLIRTADIRFKVKNLIKAAYAIEDIAIEYNGYVVNSSLTSRENQRISRDLSKDSILISTIYTPVNEMEIRVPVQYMDASLKKIAHWIDYLDHRYIKTDDATISLLSNELSRKRAIKQEVRLDKVIDKTGKKLDQVIEAEELLADKQLSADKALLNKLMLEDQVNYATIRLSIYQNQAVKQEVIANYNNIYAHLPGFGIRMKEALEDGWVLFEETLLFIANLWLFILFIILAFLSIRKYRKKKETKLEEINN